MPLMYAARAVAWSPDLSAASALMNCSCEYVITGIFDLSEKMYLLGNATLLLGGGERTETHHVRINAGAARAISGRGEHSRHARIGRAWELSPIHQIYDE